MINNDLSELSNLSIQSGTNVTTGTGAWTTHTVTFTTPFKNIPLISIIGTTTFSAENIRLISVSTTTLSYEVYTPDTTFTYGALWQAIGVI